MVFRIFVTQPSRLQHLECFEAQLYGLDPLVFYPCGEYQRIRLEVILALSYAVMQRIALVVVGFHAVQHTDDYRPVRELQTEELAFQLPETCLVFPCSQVPLRHNSYQTARKRMCEYREEKISCKRLMVYKKGVAAKRKICRGIFFSFGCTMGPECFTKFGKRFSLVH